MEATKEQLVVKWRAIYHLTHAEVTGFLDKNANYYNKEWFYVVGEPDGRFCIFWHGQDLSGLTNL